MCLYVLCQCTPMSMIYVNFLIIQVGPNTQDFWSSLCSMLLLKNLITKCLGGLPFSKHFGKLLIFCHSAVVFHLTLVVSACFCDTVCCNKTRDLWNIWNSSKLWEELHTTWKSVVWIIDCREIGFAVMYFVCLSCIMCSKVLVFPPIQWTTPSDGCPHF